MHKITSLELLRTPILCLVQLSKLRECEATDAQKLLSQSEKFAKCNFKSKEQNHFFRASKNTNSVFSATKQLMRI